MKKQTKILLSVVAVVLTGAIVLLSSNSDLFQGLSLKGKKTINKAIVARDVCPNIEKAQSKVPTGFLKDKFNGNCVLDYEIAGVLTVWNADPNFVTGGASVGNSTETLSLNFSTSGELPVTVTELNIIAVTGNTIINNVKLYDLDNRAYLSDAFALDETGKVSLANGDGLFTVNPGATKHIAIIAQTNEFAENNSRIQLGIYIESGNSTLEFYARAGNKRAPFISYVDNDAQFSDGSYGSPYLGDKAILMFRDTMTINNQTFHVIAGPVITLIRN